MENLYSNRQIEEIKWSDSYFLGIKLIDDQHKKILDFAKHMLNYTHKSEEEEREYFKEAIGQVVDYIKIHFATEEGVMLATRFPGYDEHKKAHENFILSVIKNIKDYEAGNKNVFINFSNFTRKWILSHITVMDVKYIEYFKKITIRKAEGKLSVQCYAVPC